MYTIYQDNAWALTQHGQDILCSVNVQHDCSASGCKESKQVTIRQEYAETMQNHEQVQHMDCTKYLLNIFSIHNYKTISNVIPAPLKHALSSLQFVPNSIEVKLKAAAEICQKKKSATATTTNGNAEAATHTNAAAMGLQPVQTLVPTSASTTAIPVISTVPI